MLGVRGCWGSVGLPIVGLSVEPLLSGVAEVTHTCSRTNQGQEVQGQEVSLNFGFIHVRGLMI